MALLEIVVEISELVQTVNQMNQATEIYESAVNAAQSAADELASNWEGDARDAFVKHQENAYSFYKKMLDVLRQMIDIVNEAIKKYQEMMDAVESIVGG